MTGASGYVGAAVARALALAGHDVIRGARSPRQACGEAWAAYGDLRELSDWRPVLAGCDAVVHCAGLAHVPEGPDAAQLALNVNTLATERLAEAAARAGVRRFVFMSSAHVSGADSREGILSEASEPRPGTIYARSKFDAEVRLQRVAGDKGIEWTILRPPMVYGPAAPGNFGRLVRLVRSGLPLPFGSATAQKSFIGIDSLASAVVRTAMDPGAANAMFLVSDSETISTRDLIGLIAETTGHSLRLVPVPERMMRGFGRLSGRGRDIARLFDPFVIDTGRIRQQLGWTPPFSLAEGIRRALT